MIFSLFDSTLSQYTFLFRFSFLLFICNGLPRIYVQFLILIYGILRTILRISVYVINAWIHSHSIFHMNKKIEVYAIQLARFIHNEWHSNSHFIKNFMYKWFPLVSQERFLFQFNGNYFYSHDRNNINEFICWMNSSFFIEIPCICLWAELAFGVQYKTVVLLILTETLLFIQYRKTKIWFNNVPIDAKILKVS